MKLFDDSFDIFNDEVDSAPSPETNIVYVSMNGGKGQYKSLEDLLETDSSIEVDESLINHDQSKIAIDETVMENMAYFGSVYAIIDAALTNIKANYPNGFSILSAVTITNMMMFNVEDVYKYGSPAGFPTQANMTKYKVYELSGSSINAEFEITSAIVGLTYATLTLDGNPNSGGTVDWIIAPKNDVIAPFMATLTDYEKDLLIAPFDRDNAWPRDSIVNNVLICEGASYNTFADTELTLASVTDNEAAEILWRKLYPEGQKILDSDTQLAYKLVSTYARNFDTIKKYQDALGDLHTIGYTDYNHIPNDLVLLLANQWNWSLARDLNQGDISTYIYPTFENYVTGYSQQLLSGSDVDFERWRRILANLVYLYKRKGTEACLRMFANIYGLPERLFSISELIENIEGKRDSRYITSPSNIVVHTDSGVIKYVVPTTGEIKNYPYPGFKNTKFLEVNITPVAAIEYEFYDWGWGDHDGVTDVNGNIVSFSGLSQPDEQQWYEEILQSLIPSDGTARYASSYPLLENEGTLYYSAAATPWSLTTLEPYIDFLDDNWAIIAEKLLPASSKVLSTGTLYRNQFWNRQKYVWNSSELSGKSLPFNEELPLELVTPVITKESKKQADISLANLTSNKVIKLSREFDPFSITSAKAVTVSDEISIATYPAEYVSEISDTYSLTSITNNVTSMESGSTYSLPSPLIYPMSGTSLWGSAGVGSTNLTEYSSDLIVQTNNTFFTIPFSAENISESGYTKVELELFEMSGDTLLFGDQEYSILNVVGEYDTYGIYKLSSINDLEDDDYINIKSAYVPYLNPTVKITRVNSNSNEITTEPKIGLFHLPIGENGTQISWFNYISTGILNQLRVCHNEAQQSYTNLVNLCQLWSQIDYSIPDYQELWLETISNNIEFNPDINQYKRNRLTVMAILGNFTDYPEEYAYASILVLEFLKINPNYDLSLNPYQLINSMLGSHTRATFNKIISFFDWSNPKQIKLFDNDDNRSLETLLWGLPTINMTALTENNNVSLSGGVSIGGFNDLNQRILLDKNEYFYRIKLSTSAPYSWGSQEGIEDYSGHNLVSNAYEKQILNEVKYYGRNFTFFKKANEPIIEVAPLNADGYYSPYRMIAGSASLVTFNGVGDSNKLEIQYFPITGLTTYGISIVDGTTQLTNVHLTGDTGGTYVLSGWQSYAAINGFNQTGYYNTSNWAGFTSWIDYWEGGGDSGNYWQENLGPGSGYSGWITSAQIALNPSAWWTGYTSVQYIGTIDSPEYRYYSSVTQNMWKTSGVTVGINVKDYADDGYLYTNETVLEPYSAYWWRIINYRNKKNLFGINLEIFTTTEPRLVVTGPWDGSDSIDGEIDQVPSAPEPAPPGPRDNPFVIES